MPDLKNALLLLRDGISVKIGDLLIGKRNIDRFFVTGLSRYSKVNKRLAINELNEIKKTFRDGLKSTPELQEIIGDSKIDFNLADIDGNGIGICREVDGVIHWVMDVDD